MADMPPDLYAEDTVAPVVTRVAIPKRTVQKREMPTDLYGAWPDSGGEAQSEEAPAPNLDSVVAPTPQTLPAEGGVAAFVRAAVPKIIPGLMGLVGSIAGGTVGAFGGPAAPVTIPAGAIAVGIAAESQGEKVNKWLAERLFTPEHIAAYNAQNEANAAERPLTAAAGEMVGGVASMFAGGGTAKAIPKLVRAARLSEEAIKAGKTVAEAKQVYDKAAGGARVGGALLETGVAGAVMTGGDEAQNPDATLYSTIKAAIRGGVTMAPLAFLPHSEAILKEVGFKVP